MGSKDFKCSCGVYLKKYRWQKLYAATYYDLNIGIMYRGENEHDIVRFDGEIIAKGLHQQGTVKTL